MGEAGATADHITVNDLTGTDVTQVNIDLAASGGGGDAQSDTVVLNATNGANVIDVFDFGQLDDGCFFIAMEFLEGKDLPGLTVLEESA